MNWDEKAEDYAGAHHTYEHRTPEDNRLIEKGIVNGARWQRDELRTDEAIERVAKAEFIREQADYEYFDREDWEDQHPSNQDVFPIPRPYRDHRTTRGGRR